MAYEKVKAETQFPMPEKPVGRPIKYPWRSMEVGESFLIKTQKHDNARGQVHRAQILYNRKYTTRKTHHGLRVWRTE